MLFTSAISVSLQLCVLCSICVFVEAVGCTSYSQLSITNVLTLCIISLLLLLLLLCVCLTVILSFVCCCLCLLLYLSVYCLSWLSYHLCSLRVLWLCGSIALLVRVRVRLFVSCTISFNVSNHPRTCVRLNVRSLKRKDYSASGEAGHQRQGKKNRRTERTCVRLFAQ